MKKKKKKKKKADGFLFFLKAFSLENDLFSNANGKKRKIGKENLYLTENRFCRNEMWSAVVIRHYMRHICAKGCLDSNFN